MLKRFFLRFNEVGERVQLQVLKSMDPEMSRAGRPKGHSARTRLSSIA